MTVEPVADADADAAEPVVVELERVDEAPLPVVELVLPLPLLVVAGEVMTADEEVAAVVLATPVAVAE